MALKLKETPNCSKDNERKVTEVKKSICKVGALYLAIIRFTTHCLSSIVFEAGGRTPLGNATTKSAAFNALFRRSFNLKIVILVTNIAAGLITTLMMSLGDKYGIPYLYVPWLLNTMKGMALCEGPAILNLVIALLPNVTLPAGAFLAMTIILFVEELCIWNNAFTSFQCCWKEYHNRKQHATMQIKEKLFATRKKELLSEDNGEQGMNITSEKLKFPQILEKSNSRISVKSTLDGNSSLVKNELPDITG
nr:uncharacterized protein LOC117226061 isoform X1 [Megalopta genalis]